MDEKELIQRLEELQKVNADMHDRFREESLRSEKRFAHQINVLIHAIESKIDLRLLQTYKEVV